MQWPTIPTLIMFPILWATYVRLAHKEEREVAADFGDTWRAYAAVTPRWIPRFGATTRAPGGRTIERHA